MSKTSKTLEYMSKLEDVSRKDHEMSMLVMEHAKKAKWDPEKFTNEALSFQLNTMKKANPANNQTMDINLRRHDIRDDLKNAGINRKDLSRNQYRELQRASLYIETFRPEESFPTILANARDNLEKRNALGGQNIPEDILYSIAFEDGRQMGRAPTETNLGIAVAQSEKAQNVLSKYSEAHDMFLQSQQNKSTFSKKVDEYLNKADQAFQVFYTKVNPYALPDGIQRAGEAAGEVIGTGLLIAVAISAVSHGAHAIKDMMGLEQNSYSNSAIEYVVDVNEPVEAANLSKSMLSLADLPHDAEDVAAHLAASNIQEGTIAMAGDQVRLVVPDDVMQGSQMHGWTYEKLSNYGTFEKEGQEYTEHHVVTLPNDMEMSNFSTKG